MEENELPAGLTDYRELGQQAVEAQQIKAQQERIEAETPKDQGFFPDNPAQLADEMGKAVTGGVVDAVESVGGFSKRIADTGRWAIYKAYGIQQPDERNVFHADYQVENPLEIPDEFEPENNSGLGKLTRGVAEFLALDVGTIGIGKFLKVPQYVNKASRVMRLSARTGKISKVPLLGKVAKTKYGARVVGFIPKGTKVASEGAIADLVSESSEYANMANLVNEYAPWVPFSEALSVNPEDNLWWARLKTVMAGSGFNLGGWMLYGFARGSKAAIKARAAGKSVTEANLIGTQVLEETVSEGAAKLNAATDSMQSLSIKSDEGVAVERWREFVQKHLPEDQYQSWLTLKQGNLESTAGNSIYYHGVPFKDTKQPVGYKPKTQKQSRILPGSQEFNIDKTFKTSGEEIWSDENLFGDGFYVSDDISIASKERKRGKGIGYVYELNEAGENRVTYVVKETGSMLLQDGTRATNPIKWLDADTKMKWNSKSPIANLLRKGLMDMSDFPQGLYGEFGEKARWETVWPKGEEASYGDIMARLKEEGTYPRGDTAELIDEINDAIAQLGYGGIQYKGQVNTAKGIKDHNVRVYWFPEDQIEITKVDIDGQLSDNLNGLNEQALQNGNAAGDVWDEAAGVSSKQLENINRTPSPWRNPEKFSDVEKATIPLDGNFSQQTKAAIREIVVTARDGRPEDAGVTQLFLESQIKRMAGGSRELGQYIREISEEVAAEMFKNPLNTMNFKDVQNSVLAQTAEIYKALEGGGKEYSANLKSVFEKELGDAENAIFWIHDGEWVRTGNASTKVALELVIRSLTKRVSMIAQGAIELPAGTSLTRQTDQLFDAIKVAMVETKKISYMTGSELVQQNFGNRLIDKAARAKINRDLAVIEQNAAQFSDELARLVKNGDDADAKALTELYYLSDGNVRTMEHVTEYLWAKIRGGRMDGKSIPGRWRLEARSAYYNSILSSLKTPTKAVIGTNFLASIRPIQAWLGAQSFKGADKKVAYQAAMQMDAMGQAWSEGLQMFKHNWDLGINRKDQTYATRFSFEKDIAEFKELKSYVDQYGTPTMQKSYALLDTIVDANQNPWVKYSANAMGAGDALARTVIGRMEQRLEAVNAVMALVDEGKLDINDVDAVVKNIENEFRDAIFKVDQHGKYVVSDTAARMAGDEAALTKRLAGPFEFLENIGTGTAMRAFFPFIRTGVNALELAMNHTFLAGLNSKFKDIMRGDPALLLQKYGIKAENIAYEQALLRGRMAMGNSLLGISAILSLTGNMTGDLPPDQESRDLWKANGIQPNSFKIGNAYISYRDIEPFNTLFAATANVMAYQHLLGEDIRDDFINKIGFMFTSTLVDKSMLAGVSDLGELLNWQDSSGKNLQRILAKFVRPQLVPYSGLSNQLGKIMDANEKEANGFWEYILRREAIGKSFLAPKYDMLNKDRSGKKFYPPPGNPLMTFFNAFSPIAVTWTDGDPVAQGLQEMSFDIPTILSTYKGVRLNSYELSEIQRHMSMGDLRVRLEKAMAPNGAWRQGLDRYKQLKLVNREDKVFNQKFYRIIHKIFIDEKRKAMKLLLAENPELAKRIQDRLKRKNYGSTGRYDQIEDLMNMPK